MVSAREYLPAHGHTVVELLGEIDLAVVDEIAVELDVAEARPGITLVIDLSPTMFFGSLGLRLLCRTRRVKARGGCLQLACPHALTLRILRFAGPFRVVHTLDQALVRTLG